ncbi:hypothetical protein [Lusitaniella coriacea]|uniref:hypothetical protein n=1 Tax=Lusitaniella coriacea TaxID=1983105 RepID=UPI001D136212|nr:hypothetical protein [Lusitaniella coriacea]
MKPLKFARHFTITFALIALLLCNVGCSELNNANVDSTPSPAIQKGSADSSPNTVKEQENPSPKLIQTVLEEITQKTGIPANSLQIEQTQAQTWSDGCLGLAQPDEFCTQALVSGWRIVVSDGEQTWVYRTDRAGQNIRPETPNP